MHGAAACGRERGGLLTTLRATPSHHAARPPHIPNLSNRHHQSAVPAVPSNQSPHREPPHLQSRFLQRQWTLLQAIPPPPTVQVPSATIGEPDVAATTTATTRPATPSIRVNSPNRTPSNHSPCTLTGRLIKHQVLYKKISKSRKQSNNWGLKNGGIYLDRNFGLQSMLCSGEESEPHELLPFRIDLRCLETRKLTQKIMKLSLLHVYRKASDKDLPNLGSEKDILGQMLEKPDQTDDNHCDDLDGCNSFSFPLSSLVSNIKMTPPSSFRGCRKK